LVRETWRSFDYLMDDRQRITWAEYCAVLAKGAEVWDQEDLVQIGRAFVRSRWAKPFRLAAQILFSPTEVYAWLARPGTGGLNQFFTCLETAIRQPDDQRVVLELTLEGGYQACPSLWHILRGVLIEAPAAMGARPAEVAMTELPNGARYEVLVPSKGPWWTRLRRAVSRPFAARSLARELQEAYEELHWRYDQMEAKAAERKRAEQRFRALLESAPDAMIIVDQRGTITLLNSRAEAMFGYDRRELLGREVELLVPERLREVHRGHRERFFQDPGLRPMFTAAALYGRHRDGREFPIEVTVSAMASEEGMVAVAAVRDVTERKKAEEELEEHRARLAHLGRLHTMGEMVAGIAHEINQPLYAISSYASAVIRALESDDPDGQAKVLDWTRKISDQVSRAGQIIRRLRDFARAAPAQPATLNVNDMVRESVALVEVDARPLRADIRLDLADQVPPIYADRVQIQQVLVNLLRNALEAMREVPVDQRQALVRTCPAEGGVQVSVEDRGCGLPPEGPDRLFDAFVSTKSDGMGMGLAISRSIVEIHGGHMWATDNPEGGAIFHFVLPAADGRHD